LILSTISAATLQVHEFAGNAIGRSIEHDGCFLLLLLLFLLTTATRCNEFPKEQKLSRFQNSKNSTKMSTVTGVNYNGSDRPRERDGDGGVEYVPSLGLFPLEAAMITVTGGVKSVYFVRVSFH
jgi:hypothetical protein